MEFQTTTVQTILRVVEYSDAGEGDPILYFHGTGGTGEGMMPFESELVNEGFRLIMPNRPGYGNTPLASNTSIVDCSNVAKALSETLGIERVRLHHPPARWDFSKKQRFPR